MSGLIEILKFFVCILLFSLERRVPTPIEICFVLMEGINHISSSKNKTFEYLCQIPKILTKTQLSI